MRIPRMLVNGEATVYHVMSRTALDGYPLGPQEKDVFVQLLQTFSRLYLVEVLGFAIMGNHFHLLVRMLPESQFSDDEIMQRLQEHYGDKRVFSESQLPLWRGKLASLSEFMKELKQSFTRFYNKTHQRFGFFWGQRFKSVIVEEGETLVNCLAYIDLNPVRAGLVDKPEDYRWSGLGYLLGSGNAEDLLSLEFGLPHEEKRTQSQKIEHYRRFVYEKGSLDTVSGLSIAPEVVQAEQEKGFALKPLDRFRYRSRYFTDSGIIGSQAFVARHYQRFEGYFLTQREKKPVPIAGLEGCYSLKRLTRHGC